MKPEAILLVSPGPVDGYPPVQYQARLLAQAGFKVELVTTPLTATRNFASFEYPGVTVTCIPGKLIKPRRSALRVAALARAVVTARLRIGRRNSVEICYDPIGVWISDLVPRKPRIRVAHFHELLRNDSLLIERRLKRAVRKFDHVVVPDADRARITQEKLQLPCLPLVIENYPHRADAPPVSGSDSEVFEVVYCGSLGFNQKLDAVIRSIPLWPQNAVLSLIGRDDTPTARKLIALARELKVINRVNFLGWMDLPQAEIRMARAKLGIALLDMVSEQWRSALGASNKRYQYMKAGLPQIGDANPGVPDLLEGNGIGACVTEHDPAQIAALVRIYAANPLRVRAEGERAFELHLRNYNYSHAFRRFLDLFDGCPE